MENMEMYMFYKFLFITHLFCSVVLNNQLLASDEMSEIWDKATTARLLAIRYLASDEVSEIWDNATTDRQLAEKNLTPDNVREMWDNATTARQLAEKDLTPDNVREMLAIADRYRRNPVITWWYHIGSLVNNYADDVISLHHLAGSIQHIISVITDDNYYQHTRRCEWSQHLQQVEYAWDSDSKSIVFIVNDGDAGYKSYEFSAIYQSPKNLVEGRNCVNDLWSAFDIIGEFENLWQTNTSVPDALHKKLESLERDFSSYKTQRKLSFKNINVSNSISFNEEECLSKKFAREDVPFLALLQSE